MQPNLRAMLGADRSQGGSGARPMREPTQLDADLGASEPTAQRGGGFAFCDPTFPSGPIVLSVGFGRVGGLR